MRFPSGDQRGNRFTRESLTSCTAFAPFASATPILTFSTPLSLFAKKAIWVPSGEYAGPNSLSAGSAARTVMPSSPGLACKSNCARSQCSAA